MRLEPDVADGVAEPQSDSWAAQFLERVAAQRQDQYRDAPLKKPDLINFRVRSNGAAGALGFGIDQRYEEDKFPRLESRLTNLDHAGLLNNLADDADGQGPVDLGLGLGLGGVEDSVQNLLEDSSSSL